MKNQYMLGIHNNSVNEKITTHQFLLSELIMEKRYLLNLDVCQMAKITNQTIENYLKLEYGDTDLSISEYKDALRLIESYE